MENVAYQASLLFWFSEISQNQLQLEGLQFLPLSPKGQAKPVRISQMFKRLQKENFSLVSKKEVMFFMKPQFTGQIKR